MTTSPNPNHAEEARRLLELPIPITEEQEAGLTLAADQTPATDSERVERLCEARDLVQEARVSGFTQIDSDTVFAIDDEVTRLAALLAEQAATIERVGAVRDKHWGTRNSLLANEINAALGSQRTEGQG